MQLRTQLGDSSENFSQFIFAWIVDKLILTLTALRGQRVAMSADSVVVTV